MGLKSKYAGLYHGNGRADGVACYSQSMDYRILKFQKWSNSGCC